jgi:hypothetical protein
MQTGGHVSLRVVNVTYVDLDSLTFTPNFVSQFCIAKRWVNLLEAIAGFVSEARTAVWSAIILKCT